MLSLLLLDNNEKKKRKQDKMLRHDTGRDDNQEGSGGHNMHLTLTNGKAYNTQIQTDPPM